MSDPLVPWLSAALPTWLPAQLLSGLIGILAGIFIGRGLSLFGDWWTKRRERISSDEMLRKLAAKRVNEHIKLLGSFCNTVGAAVIGAAVIVPYIGHDRVPGQDASWWFGVGIAFHVAGHFALRFMKSEG